MLCIPCDDPIYGKGGCGGTCIALNEKIITQNGECEGCLSGYFNLNGFCYQCSENCRKCSYTNDEVKCLACYDESKYQIKNGKCEKCKMDGCLDCHYSKSNITICINNYLIYCVEPDDPTYDYSHPACDKCLDGYYIDPYLSCKLCHDEKIENGSCKICQEKNTNKNENCSFCFDHFINENGEKICNFCINNNNNNNIKCTCDKGYNLTDIYTCQNCTENCRTCDNENNSCIKCINGYTSIDEKCIKCGENCNSCSPSNGNLICDSCVSGHKVNEDGNCFDCPKNCSSCKKDVNNNLICTKCENKFSFDNNNEW